MRDLIFKERRAGLIENFANAWRGLRGPVVVPLLQLAVYLCAVMSVMLFVERVYMAIVIVCVKVLRKKSYTKYKLKLDTVRKEIEDSGTHPKVLVQIPMFNEREVIIY
jgi:beta-mannan synthase